MHTSTPKTYSGSIRGFRQSVWEAIELYRLHSRDVPDRIGALLDDMREMDAMLESRYDFPLRGRRALDIGAGQRLIQLAYISQANDAIGIDLDVIAQRFTPRSYVRMLAANGFRRTAKTMARKALRIDARYQAELERQLGLVRIPLLTVLRMDASDMTFSSSSFDFVFSYSVFHHLPDPAKGIREAARVLRPGGIAYISFHLYTSATGSLDPRFFPTLHPEAPRWPHLRPALAGHVRQNATANKLRLAQWHDVFDAVMPGCEIIYRDPDSDRLAVDLARLRERGELNEYSDDELLTNEIAVIWRKPS